MLQENILDDKWKKLLYNRKVKIILDVTLMDKKYYNAVIEEMQALLDGQKFVADGDIFKNEKKAVKVSFNEEAKMWELFVADVTEDTVGEFSLLASWLFEDDQTERDAAAVGVDFADTLRSALGLKKNVTKTAGQIALPTTEKGDAVTVSTLIQKLLATFPEFKEEYKESVAKYGKFLSVEFFTTRFAPAIKQMLANQKGNKKAVKKLFDMLKDLYVEGDTEAVDMVVALICSAIYGKEEFIKIFEEQAADNTHLISSVKELMKLVKSNKKLREALVK